MNLLHDPVRGPGVQKTENLIASIALNFDTGKSNGHYVNGPLSSCKQNKMVWLCIVVKITYIHVHFTMLDVFIKSPHGMSCNILKYSSRLGIYW